MEIDTAIHLSKTLRWHLYIYIYDMTSNFLLGKRARVFGQSVVCLTFIFIKIYVLCVHVKITVTFFLILEIFLIPWNGEFGENGYMYMYD